MTFQDTPSSDTNVTAIAAGLGITEAAAQGVLNALLVAVRRGIVMHDYNAAVAAFIEKLQDPAR